MKTLLAILFLLAAITGRGAEIPLAWDASPYRGATNYSVYIGTNSLASGNTNWLVQSVGTNLSARVQIEGAARLWIHVRAYWPDGLWAASANELPYESRPAPTNLRTLALEYTYDLRGTNWAQFPDLFLKLRVLNP